MSFRLKITLAFGLMTLIIVGGIFGWLSYDIASQFDNEFQLTSTKIDDLVDRRLAEIEASLNQSLTTISQSPTLRKELLEPLTADKFYDNNDYNYEANLLEQAKKWVVGTDLDVFRIIDAKHRDPISGQLGYVVATGHRTGYEALDKAMLLWTQRPSKSGVFYLDTLYPTLTEQPQQVLVLEQAQSVNARISLVAGKRIDSQLLSSLTLAGSEIALHIGDQLTVQTEGYAQLHTVPHSQRRRILQTANDNSFVVELSVIRDKRPLDNRIKRMIYLAALAVAIGCLLSFLMGSWLAKRFSRSLEQLANAATQISAGQRDTIELESARRGGVEFRQLTDAFEKMVTDIDRYESELKQAERIAAWRDIARQIAHEIKNPLFPIQTSAETLVKAYHMNHPDFAEILTESSETIVEEVNRVKGIITEFSQFARLPAPKMTDFDLAELCIIMVNFHRPTLKKEGILHYQGPSHVMVHADEDQLRQVLTNLIQNAIDATVSNAHSAEVTVSLNTHNGRVTLSVTDNGCGMDEKTAKQIFEPYFTTKSSGTGLGLPIVFRIISEHGAQIKVDSQPQKGTCIWIEFNNSHH